MLFGTSTITEDACDIGRAYIPSPAVDTHHYSSPHLPHLPGQEWTSHHLHKPNTWDPQTAELIWWGRINSWMKNSILVIPKPRAVSSKQNPCPEVCWCNAWLLLQRVSQNEPWVTKLMVVSMLEHCQHLTHCHHLSDWSWLLNLPTIFQ